MRKFIVIAVLLLITLQAHATFTAQDYLDGKTYLGSGNKLLDPLYLFIDDSASASTVGKEFFFFIPSAAPASIEGYMWYDSTGDVIKYRNASGTVTLSGVGPGESGTLDDAYNSGFAIDVDGTAVTLTVSLGDNNAALIVNANDATNNANGIEVVVASSNTGAGLYVNGTTGTIDLLGDNFSMANTGILTMTSGDSIDNSTTDDIFQFSSNDKEDFSIDLSGTNIIGFSSDTSAVTLEFNALDKLTGVETITGDAGADFALATTNTGTFNFTLAQSGTGDNELRLTSAGTAANAIALTASTGGITATAATSITGTSAAGAISLTSTGGDATFASADASVNITAAEADAAAIVIDASNAAGGIDMDCGSAGFDLTVTAGDLTLQNTTTKDIILDATAGRVLITGSESAADAILLTADGANGEIAISAAVGGVDIDGVLGAVTINTTKNSGNAIHIEENGGTSAGINIYANQGIGASATTEDDASIQLHSDDGGIGLYTTANVADAVRIETNGGVDEFITINNLQGTGADAITIRANAAGGNVNLFSVLGSIKLLAEENAADAILLQVDGINSTTLRLLATTGTSVAEDGAAIQLSALVGGISIQSDANLDDALVLRVDGGTTSEMTITNDQGDTTDSIEIASAAGGILINAAKPVAITNAFELDIVIVPDASPYTVLANNSGQVHMIPALGQDTTFNLPAEADGLHYKFIYVGNAADAEDWIITSGSAGANFFIGGAVQHDEDGDLTVTYYPDGNSNDTMGVLTPEAGTVVEMWCDGVNWYLSATVISATNTGVTFSD